MIKDSFYKYRISSSYAHSQWFHVKFCDDYRTAVHLAIEYGENFMCHKLRIYERTSLDEKQDNLVLSLVSLDCGDWEHEIPLHKHNTDGTPASSVPAPT